jgi:glutathione S-transferase
MATHPKLYSSSTSPFVRRVHLAFRRLGLSYDFEAVGNLFPPPPQFVAINPLGLIPALHIQGEEVIVDSSEILSWMDQKYGGVWPKEMDAGWRDRRLSALSAGVMTLAVAWRLESVRPSVREADQLEKEGAILATLDKISQGAAFVKLRTSRQKMKESEDPLKYCFQGSYDLAAALDYLLFRLPHLKWAERFDELNELLLDFSENEIFQSTDPRK